MSFISKSVVRFVTLALILCLSPFALSQEEVEGLGRSVQLNDDEVYGDGDRVYWNEKDELVMLEGNAFIKYQNVELSAGKIWFDFRQNLVRAQGNVSLKVGDEQTFSQELIFDVKSKVGKVLDGVAYSPPWFYSGRRIYKVSEKESLVEGGRITSCSLKHPHFWFEASKIIVKVDQELIAKHVILKIGGVPMLYLPVYRRDLRKEKKARVIVKLGMDSYQGYFMHVIYPLKRSKRIYTDLFYEYTSRRGMGEGFEANYNVDDVRLRDILIKLPKDASRIEAKKAEEKANEVLDRLRGDYDKFHLERIFIRYDITKADIENARKKAEKIRRKAISKGTSFGKLARQYSDDMDTKYMGGDLGYLIRGEGKLSPKIEKIVFSLHPGEISEVIKTEGGFEIYKVEDILERYGLHEVRVRKIRIEIRPSEETMKSAQAEAGEAYKELKAGKPFDEVAHRFSKTDPDMGWVGLNELDARIRYRIRRLKKGEWTDPIQLDDGVYIFKLIERKPTPTFEELARQFSEGKEAERGGDLGYRGRWELPREVRRVAYTTLDEGDVSGVIRAKDGFHVVKLEDRRFFSGQIFLFTGDIYSYGRKKTYKTGRRWDFIFNHRQIISTPWDSRKDQRGLILLTKASLGRRSLIGGYGTPSSELRTMASLTWTTLLGERMMREIRSRLLARLTLDKTFELVEGERSYAIQELPELYLSWSGGKMYNLPLLKQINEALKKAVDRIKSERFPILTLPTLDNTYISSDATIGNYYKAEYAGETDIYLQTGDITLDASKDGAIELTPYHEIRYGIRTDANLIWHSKDRAGNRNIFAWSYGLNTTSTMDLFRIYDISFIPNANKLKHTIDMEVDFNYSPSIQQKKNLYPFGPTAYTYEKKRLYMELRSLVEVKTRRNFKYTLLDFDAYTARDFTRDIYLGYRKWDYLRSRLYLTPLPSGNLRIGFTSTHDPNPRDGKKFKQIGFSSSLSYRRGDYAKGWEFHLGNQFTKFYKTPSRTILAGFDLRPNRLFQIELDVQYDWVRREFYSQRLTIRRNLHDWDLRVSWYKIGYGESARKDFTFQINLIADPSVAIGVGYDAVTESWGLRSLPVGVPYYGGFIGRGLGRSY
ncbi:peptidylprolyl isomerase [Candidatus Poribacteria bacterium]|nr:peptidylprolyl isomerase [Candidatus Poribacteria bacterium]